MSKGFHVDPNEQVITLVADDPGDRSVGIQPMHEQIEIILSNGGWPQETLDDLTQGLKEFFTEALCECGGKCVTMAEYLESIKGEEGN